MNPTHKCHAYSTFTAFLLAAFIQSATCSAQGLTDDELTLTGFGPRVVFDVDFSTEWGIFGTFLNTLEFTSNSGGDFRVPFIIASEARDRALTLGINGAGIHGFASNPHELEVFGALDNDTFAALAVTPEAGEHSVRLAINTNVNAWGIDARSIGANGGSDFYQAVIRSSLDAPTNSIAMDGFGQVGIGGVQFEDLQADLHIGGETIYFDSNGPRWDWLLAADDDRYSVTSIDSIAGTETRPFAIEVEAPDAGFYMNEDGDIGLGTDWADASLHVYREDGTAMLKVEDVSTTVANRAMLELVNNGGVRMALDNENVNQRWEFFNNRVGDFNITRSGTGGTEFAITRGGGLTAGPAGALALDLRPTGNLFITGTLFESSDRDKKENFEEVDCEEVLNQIAELPISTWNYKTDDDGVRHMGPVAQDFKEAFDLGDSDKTIATTDKAGISLAAIKALNAKHAKLTSELHSKLADKDVELEALNSRLEKLEALLSNSLK